MARFISLNSLVPLERFITRLFNKIGIPNMMNFHENKEKK